MTRTENRRLKVIHTSILFLMIWSFSLTIGISTLFAQSAQHTENSADQTLRSSGSVNPSSLGMQMSIPIGSYPGRGISIPVSISYSSKVWRMEYNGMEMIGGTSNNQGCFSKNVPKYSENSASGWTSSMGIAYVEYTGEDNIFTGDGKPAMASDFCDDTENQYHGYIKRIQIHLPSGASHELRASDTPNTYLKTIDPAPINMSGTYYSVDGSNLKYIESSRKLYLPDGSYYDFSSSTSILSDKTIRKATKYSDINGNYVTYYEPTNTYPNGYWIDTLGKTIPVPLSLSSPTSPDVVEYDMPGIDGITRTYKFHWKLLKDTTEAESGLTVFTEALRHVGDHSGLPEGEYSPTGPALFHSGWKDKAIAHQNDPLFNPVVLTAVELPDGQIYEFSYNIYGEIEHIEYPTGSKEEFIYDDVPALSSFISTATIPSTEGNRGVTERKVYESSGATPYTWTYSSGGSNNGSIPVRTRTIIAPDGTKSEIDYHKGNPPPCTSCSGNQGSWGFTNILTGMTLESRSYASNGGVILSKTKTTWDKTEFNVPNGEEDAEWHPRVTKVESIIYDLSGNYLSSTSTMAYAGNLNDIDNHLDVNLRKKYGYTTTIGGLGTLEKQTEKTVMEYDSTFNNWTEYENRHIIGLPTKVVTKDGNNIVASQSEIKYDEAGFSSGTYRGQVTKTRSWLDTNSSWVETLAKYDIHGNVTETTDAKGNISKIEYGDNYSDISKNNNTNAFPTKAISAIPGGNGSTTAFETITEYDFHTGLPVKTTNTNEQTSEIEYDDPLLRPTKATAPNGYQTTTEYGVPDTSGQLPESERFTKVKSQIDDTNWSESYRWFDGLGRTIKTKTNNDDGDIFTKTKYDSGGRIDKTSNPYRGENTPDNQLEWTTNLYDVAGRVDKVQTPDLAEVTTNYSIATTGSNIGTVVKVTDQAGKERRSITNGLGQLIRVDEPTTGGLGTIANPNQSTSYDYDILNNLTTVNQGQQTRTFQYDSLSRLKQVTNPESGTISYAYDNNGNLISKTDARNITTSYVYDNINRVTQRSYNDSVTPAVDYFYDNLPNANGQLIKVSSSVSITEYTEFDTMGRLKSHKQTTDGEIYTTSYEYNLSGAMIEQTYPSGRKVKNVLNDDGELSMVQSKKNANSGYFDYAKNFTYASHGGVESMQLGNGKWESTSFNERLQPLQIALGKTPNTSDLLELDFTYGSTDNNGNVKTQTITVPNGFTAIQTYSYDELNRLKSATETIGGNQSWRQTYTFDRYGNRGFDTSSDANGIKTTTLDSGCTTAVCNPTIDPATNKLIGYQFDTAGNTEKDAENRKFTYDGENKQIKVETLDANGNVTGIIGEYWYDGDGNRVKTKAGTKETIFIYNGNGQKVAEYSTQTTQTPKVSYLTSDHLGSPRITTDLDGNIYSRRDFMPFGEEIDVGHTPERTATLNYAIDEIKQKFTTYERDNETELDFAEARMYSSKLGRFMVPDIPFMDQFQSNPQSWNLYSYVRNNPLKLVDPSGMKVDDPGFWEGLFNYFSYGYWVTDEEITRMEKERRKWFKDNNISYRDENGNVRLFDIDSLTTQEVFDFYKELKTLEEDGKLKAFTAEEIASAASNAPIPVPGYGGTRAPKKSGGWKPPTKHADDVIKETINKAKDATKGLEAGRHGQWMKKAGNRLIEEAKKAKKRGDLPEYWKKLEKKGKELIKQASQTNHPGGNRP